MKSSTSMIFNVLIKKEGNLFLAHCLELDLVAAAKTFSRVKKEMRDIIETQVDYAFSNDNLDHLYKPAPSEVWREFYACWPWILSFVPQLLIKFVFNHIQFSVFNQTDKTSFQKNLKGILFIITSSHYLLRKIWFLKPYLLQSLGISNPQSIVPMENLYNVKNSPLAAENVNRKNHPEGLNDKNQNQEQILNLCHDYSRES